MMDFFFAHLEYLPQDVPGMLAQFWSGPERYFFCLRCFQGDVGNGNIAGLRLQVAGEHIAVIVNVRIRDYSGNIHHRCARYARLPQQTADIFHGFIL